MTASTVASDTFSTITCSCSTCTYNLTINSTAIYAGSNNVADGASLSPSAVAAQINLFSSQTGVSAAVSGTTLMLTAADGRNVVVTETLIQGLGATLTGSGISANQEGTLRGTITLSAGQNVTLGGVISAIGFAGSVVISFHGITGFLGTPSINEAGLVTVAATLDDGSTSILAGSGGALVTIANTAVDGLSSLDSKPFVCCKFGGALPAVGDRRPAGFDCVFSISNRPIIPLHSRSRATMPPLDLRCPFLCSRTWCPFQRRLGSSAAPSA